YDPGRELAHHLRRRGDLADRLFLDAEAHGERCDHHRSGLSTHDLAHESEHLVVEDLAVLDRALERFLHRDRHDHLRQYFRKFATSACLGSVRIASGWNCTPSTAASR